MKLKTLVGQESGLTAESGEIDIVGLTADSREVKPGYLFAALPGVQVDGARFIKDAVDRGASAVLMAQDGEMDGHSLSSSPASSAPVFLKDRNPRKRLALLAAQFYGAQPGVVAAVTGTNGKTSVATFVREIWEALGVAAASLGTVGVVSPSGERELGFTTPDPVRLHQEVLTLTQEGVTHLAMEASSHGLAQHRLDGLQVNAAGYTNISRDHLDYHATFDEYAYAKLRLFGEVMAPGGVAVLNADANHFQEFEAVSWARGHRILSVGRKGRGICLTGVRPNPRGQTMRIVHEGKDYEIDLPLAGEFQASNALVAAGLVIGCGGEAGQVFKALEGLKGAKGRLEAVAHLSNGASIYVDYAHTPDGLETALNAMRPHTKGRLVVVFGCGGDRDAGKRPQMGEIAIRCADVVFVTDDNPRSETPASIRDEIMVAAAGAQNVGDRQEAISQAVQGLMAGDVLIVAGKGHETGQVLADRTIDFSDHEAVAFAVKNLGDEKNSPNAEEGRHD